METRTIPAFINAFPCNDMLLDGKLRVGEYGVKTVSRIWNHRGLTLLHTSKTAIPLMEREHGYDRRTGTLGAIVGFGQLRDVRLLTYPERVAMFCNFNPSASLQEATAFVNDGPQFADRPRVAPYPFGYFFTDLRRFEFPVAFSKQGAVRFVNIPLGLVKHQLLAAGVKV